MKASVEDRMRWALAHIDIPSQVNATLRQAVEAGIEEITRLKTVLAQCERSTESYRDAYVNMRDFAEANGLNTVTSNL